MAWNEEIFVRAPLRPGRDGTNAHESKLLLGTTRNFGMLFQEEKQNYVKKSELS